MAFCSSEKANECECTFLHIIWLVERDTDTQTHRERHTQTVREHVLLQAYVGTPYEHVCAAF